MKQNNEWNFITIHGLVMLYISRHPDSTKREMALALNVTERTISRVIDNLYSAGYIDWHREGRGNVYKINAGRELRHELTKETAVGDLLNLLGDIPE